MDQSKPEPGDEPPPEVVAAQAAAAKGPSPDEHISALKDEATTLLARVAEREEATKADWARINDIRGILKGLTTAQKYYEPGT